MMPTETIIATAVASAATSTDVRRNERRQAARSQQRFHAEKFSQHAARDPRDKIHQRRHGRMPRRQSAKWSPDIRTAVCRPPPAYAPRTLPITRAIHGNRKITPFVCARVIFASPLSHRVDRRNLHRLSRRCQIAEATATPTPISSASRHANWPSTSIGPGRLLTYNDSTVSAINFTAPLAMILPSGNPSSAPASPRHAASPRKQPEHPARLAPKRAHNSDFRAPPHHGNRNCVVDQKCSDDQRDIAQQPQIPAKCRQHLAIFFRAGRLADEFPRPRQNALQLVLPFLNISALGNLDKNAIYSPKTIQHALCRRQCPSARRFPRPEARGNTPRTTQSKARSLISKLKCSPGFLPRLALTQILSGSLQQTNRLRDAWPVIGRLLRQNHSAQCTGCLPRSGPARSSGTVSCVRVSTAKSSIRGEIRNVIRLRA